MSDQTGTTNQQRSTGQTVLIVLLVLAGVALVLVIGIWVGRTMSSETLPEGPEIPLPPPPTEGPYVVANAYINVRSGPGTAYPAYGVAPAGASAVLIGSSDDGDWWLIQVPTSVSADGTAWVSAEYVTAYNTEQLPVPEPLE